MLKGLKLGRSSGRAGKSKREQHHNKLRGIDGVLALNFVILIYRKLFVFSVEAVALHWTVSRWAFVCIKSSLTIKIKSLEKAAFAEMFSLARSVAMNISR